MLGQTRRRLAEFEQKQGLVAPVPTAMARTLVTCKHGRAMKLSGQAMILAAFQAQQAGAAISSDQRAIRVTHLRYSNVNIWPCRADHP